MEPRGYIYTTLARDMYVCMYVCIYDQEQSTHGVAITAPSLGQVRDMQETSTFTQTITAHVTIVDKHLIHTTHTLIYTYTFVVVIQRSYVQHS